MACVGHFRLTVGTITGNDNGSNFLLHPFIVLWILFLLPTGQRFFRSQSDFYCWNRPKRSLPLALWGFSPTLADVRRRRRRSDPGSSNRILPRRPKLRGPLPPGAPYIPSRQLR